MSVHEHFDNVESLGVPQQPSEKELALEATLMNFPDVDFSRAPDNYFGFVKDSYAKPFFFSLYKMEGNQQAAEDFDLLLEQKDALHTLVGEVNQVPTEGAEELSNEQMRTQAPTFCKFLDLMSFPQREAQLEADRVRLGLREVA